jgi:hypothetical protein
MLITGSTVEPGMGLTASSMATLRPLFKTFFSRSRLVGSSTKRTSSRGWGQPNQPSRNGYYRSAGKNNNNDVEELGLNNLRSDLPKGGGTSTTIQSLNDPRDSTDDRNTERELKEVPRDINMEATDNAKRVKRFGSGSSKILHGAANPGFWDSSDSHVAEDSCSESSTLAGGLGIRKTTEVTTVRE